MDSLNQRTMIPCRRASQRSVRFSRERTAQGAPTSKRILLWCTFAFEGASNRIRNLALRTLADATDHIEEVVAALGVDELATNRTR